MENMQGTYSSMHPRSPKLLEDIREAAAFIREVAKGKSLARLAKVSTN